MRYEKLDILRGIAIVLMVLFHLNYILVHIFWIDSLNFSSIFWLFIGKIWALLFIIISGISFFLAEKKYDNKIVKKYLKYAFFLWIISLCISFFTYFFLPSQIILFGILHFFSLSFLLILFFRRLRYFNFLFGICIMVFPLFFSMRTSLHYLFFLGFLPSWFYSADFYPIFPYFWVFLFSYASAIFLSKKEFLETIFWWKYRWKIISFLKFIWKNSLLIYLIHPPLIIGIIYLILKFL
jgi:uncharacterized membrane protein